MIGFDSRPDSFTTAVLQGTTPSAAELEKMFNKVQMGQLQSRAKKHTTSQDLIVLEASATASESCERWPPSSAGPWCWRVARWARLKEAHANNDKISAVRIGKAYLAGTAKTVCVPDAKTQERRVCG